MLRENRELIRDLIGDIHPELWGDCSGLWGDCSGLSGDCSRLSGNCSHL